MAKRNPRSDRSKFDSYMKEVTSYNAKVDRGRSVKGVDPDQEAFSDEVETLRQTNAINKANAYDKLMQKNTQFK